MNVKNCRKCGRIFNYVVGPPICPACREAVEAKFQGVKKYVQEHQNVGIPEIARECEVEISQIQGWIRDERLVFSADSPIGIECENCGAMIKTGRFCEKCKGDMARSFSPQSKSQPAQQMKKDTKEAPKMRFLDK